MAGVRLQWAKFGKVDSFNIYRSDTSIDPSNLPPPLAVGLTQCEYWDTDITKRKGYYYSVASVLSGVLSVSDEVLFIFTNNNNFLFSDTEGYTPPSGRDVNFNW